MLYVFRKILKYWVKYDDYHCDIMTVFLLEEKIGRFSNCLVTFSFHAKV